MGRKLDCIYSVVADHLAQQAGSSSCKHNAHMLLGTAGVEPPIGRNMKVVQVAGPVNIQPSCHSSNSDNKASATILSDGDRKMESGQDSRGNGQMIDFVLDYGKASGMRDIVI
ncbi:hypothetical protein EON65_52245 [archaeon]|nr:MAG: hypothetical protein EON65_52245 [archaeon]